MQALLEYRCVCGKLLFKAARLSGAIDVKCRSCGHMFSLEKSGVDGVHRPDWTVCITASGIFAGATASFGKILGYKAETLVGSNFFNLFLSSDAKKLRSFFLKIIEEDRSARCSAYRMPRINGDILWVSTTFIPYQVDPGSRGFFVASRLSSLPGSDYSMREKEYVS